MAVSRAKVCNGHRTACASIQVFTEYKPKVAEAWPKKYRREMQKLVGKFAL